MKALDIIFLIIGLIIIVLSLLQGGKSEGASGAITGGGLNVFVKTKERGAEKVVSIMTLIFVVIFFVTAIIIAVVSNNAAAGGGTSEETTEAAVRLFHF